MAQTEQHSDAFAALHNVKRSLVHVREELFHSVKHDQSEELKELYTTVLVLEDRVGRQLRKLEGKSVEPREPLAEELERKLKAIEPDVTREMKLTEDEDVAEHDVVVEEQTRELDDSEFK